MNKAVHDRHEASLFQPSSEAVEASFGYQATKGLTGLSKSELRYQFIECRNQLQSLQRIYQSCSSRSGGHTREANTVRGFRNEIDWKITILKKRSIYIVYKQAKDGNFREIDLHGLYLDEAQECVILVLDTVLKIMMAKNEKKLVLVTLGSLWTSSLVEDRIVKGSNPSWDRALSLSSRVKITRSGPQRTTAT